jgi:O-methyltransferase/methyltransferase family protein
MPGQQSDWTRSAGLQDQMARMIMGFWVSQAVRAFAALSVADHLVDGPVTAAELAHREGSALETTFRLLRTGVALGLVTVDRGGRFHATALLDTLRVNAPGSLRGMALALTNRAHWLSWGEFEESVRTGRSRFPDVLGVRFGEYLQQNPEMAEEISAAMADITSLWCVDVAHGIDTTGVGVAVDVGGRDWTLLRLLQQANPTLRGIVAGDVFGVLPAADLYLLRSVLHDWDDLNCVRILRACRAAMQPDGRIAIAEMLVGDQDDPGVVTLLDLNKMAVGGGRERSLAEFDGLLAAAELRRIAVWSADSPQSVIEAVAHRGTTSFQPH